MATKLKNLKITKVDFVDEGANPDAHIMLFKSKDGKPDEESKEDVAPETETDPEGEGQAEGDGKTAKKSLAKRMVEVLKEFFGSTDAAQEQTLDIIEKDARSFKETFGQRQLMQICDEIWAVTYALNDSVCSIMGDEDLDESGKASAANQSIDDFAECAKKCIESWAGGQPSNLITKSKQTSEQQIEIMKSARDRLDLMLRQATGSESEVTVNLNKSKGVSKDMKFDKSKMSPAERAMLEEFEKKYAADGETTEEETEPKKKAADEKEGDEPEVTKRNAEAEPGEDIYKGIAPEVKAEIEALRKFRQDTEDKELRQIAKGYAIIGKTEDELFPVLKSLKEASKEAYDQMIDTLNKAKDSVEKSGAFSEIGKSGNGSIGSDAWAMAEAKAGEIMKNKTGINKNQALSEVFAADPELAKKCREED